MSGKGPSTKNRSKVKDCSSSSSSSGTKLKKEISTTSETPAKNVVQCGGTGEMVKVGGRHKKKRGGGGKKQKVVESWKWIMNNNNNNNDNNSKAFSPRQQQKNKKKKKNPWLDVEQGMAYYLKWDEGLVEETQDWKLGQNCSICGRDVSYAPIPPEAESGTHNFPEVAVLSCGHVFHMICFSSFNHSTDPSCFKCSTPQQF